jgi:hypothetical protein
MQWTRPERCALAALQSAGVELVHGVSDEGDPWCVVYHRSSNRVLAHFARIDGWYVGCWGGTTQLRGGCLRSVLDLPGLQLNDLVHGARHHFGMKVHQQVRHPVDADDGIEGRRFPTG